MVVVVAILTAEEEEGALESFGFLWLNNVIVDGSEVLVVVVAISRVRFLSCCWLRFAAAAAFVDSAGPPFVLREGERDTKSEPDESAVAADDDGGGGGGWGGNEVGAPATDEGRGTGLTLRRGA